MIVGFNKNMDLNNETMNLIFQYGYYKEPLSEKRIGCDVELDAEHEEEKHYG